MSEFKPQEYKQTPFVTVEAIQLNADNADDVVKWVNDKDTEIFRTSTKNEKHYILSVYIQTPHGKICARSGEYIVKYSDGSFQVLTKKQFNQRYETQTTTIPTNYSTRSETLNKAYDILMNPWGADPGANSDGYIILDDGAD